MPTNGPEVVYEGWLTKSPPTKRIVKARWRRRWFSLHSGELPGQFQLTYYTDRNCRKLKGVIDLDHCEQVDLGLKHEEKKLKFDHVFDIRTPTRTYYLAADSESEMMSWVNCICKVCGLKSTNEEDDLQRNINNATADVEIIEEENVNTNESPLISPVSTSPYIPIFECITGRSPIVDSQDFKSLLEHNLRNSMIRTEAVNHSNETYGFDPRFYDCPRKLLPPPTSTLKNYNKEQNQSPLQSPTDSESVFTDDDWVHNTSDLNSSKNTRPSDSSVEVDMTVTQRFTKMTLENQENPPIAPPRPPKPAHITPNYFNISTTSINKSKENWENDKSETKLNDSTRVINDDSYDFPRSHNLEGTIPRRHCYNNAAPVSVEEQIFRYDMSPKPGTSTTMFKYDSEDAQDEPASPLSQSSSTALYSNLPSPLFLDSHNPQLMPPPVVNRGLKPKRKLSDTLSISSNPEPSSPRLAPSVDRKLKPTTPLQSSHSHTDEDNTSRKFRAAPSPTPLNLGRSHESLIYQNQNDQEQIYHYLPGNKNMQYLDLDLEYTSSTHFTSSNTNSLPLRSPGANTVYKKVDFMKTEAFNKTRNNLEKERKETVTFYKK